MTCIRHRAEPAQTAHRLQRDGNGCAASAEAAVSAATALAPWRRRCAVAAVAVALAWQRSSGVGVHHLVKELTSLKVMCGEFF